MPGDNGFWFNDDQDVAPRRPKTAEQNPKHSILDSEPRVRLFSFEYAQLLTEGKDLEAEVVAGTEERAEAGEQADEKWNRGTCLPEKPRRRLILGRPFSAVAGP
jgi:hypothetical protein